MSNRTCPACGQAALSRWRPATPSDPHLAGSGPFALDRCHACGTAITVGDAPDRAAMYEGGTYAEARGLGRVAIAPLRRLAERDRMRFVRQLPQGSRVLEVGAGDGKLVEAMRAGGLDAHGIDPSPAAASAARLRGVEVATVAVEEAEIAPSSQDAVVVWHALEHVDDPEATARRLREWLRPGGTVVIGVPNIASAQASIGGDRWFHQDVPRHRIHFTPRGLAALLGRSGFEPLRTRHLLVEHNALGMWQTMLNRLTVQRDFAFRMLKRDLERGPTAERARDLVVTVGAGAVLAPIAVAAELIAGLGGRGGTIVTEARAAA